MPWTGEELSPKAPAGSECPLGFCQRYVQLVLAKRLVFCLVEVWRIGGGLPSSLTLCCAGLGNGRKMTCATFRLGATVQPPLACAFPQELAQAGVSMVSRVSCERQLCRRAQQAVRVIQQGEQRRNAVQSCRAMETVSFPQTRATLQAVFGVRFLYGLK